MLLKLFFVLGAIFCVCCNKSNQSNDDNLLYWCSNNPGEIEFAAYLVEQWNSLNPTKKVRFQPIPEGRSSEEVILAAVVGETTPDIYSNMWQGDVEYYAQADILIPFDNFEDFKPFLRQRCDSIVITEVVSNDGHIYQIPWKINPIMMIYNKNLLAEIGYQKPPVTYSDYIEAANRFQTDTDSDGYVDRWIGHREILVTWWQRFFDFYPLYLAASGGAKLVDNNKVVFNNKYSVQVFKFLNSLYENNYFSREMLSARQDVFLSGVIATKFVGPWEIAHIEKFKSSRFKYNFAALPVPDDFKDEAYTYGDPKNMVIFKSCKYPTRAWQFIKFATSKEMDLKLLEMATQIPRRKDLLTAEEFIVYYRTNPKMIPFIKQAKYVRGTDSCAQLKEIFDVISQEYEACVIYGVKTAEQAVADAARVAQSIID